MKTLVDLIHYETKEKIIALQFDNDYFSEHLMDDALTKININDIWYDIHEKTEKEIPAPYFYLFYFYLSDISLKDGCKIIRLFVNVCENQEEEECVNLKVLNQDVFTKDAVELSSSIITNLYQRRN